MFNLYVDLIIYSMALKSPDGELSLEVVFCIFFLYDVAMVTKKANPQGAKTHPINL